MKKKVLLTVMIIIIAALIVFNVVTVRRVSRRPEPAEPPDLNESPMRVYGVVEPMGKEVRVSPLEPGVVNKLYVEEGDTVKVGQLLCVLESSVQKGRLETAGSRVALARTAAELSRDRYRRNRALLEDGSISESQYTELKLKMQLDEKQLAVYQSERKLATVRLENLKLASPRSGIVYLLDIREGEFFGREGESRIIIGSSRLQVRCDVEVIWIDRLKERGVYTVFNAETGKPVGRAVHRGSSRYLKAARFSTEDPQKRLSARYQEVVMDFTPSREDIPIRLPVMVELSGSASPDGK